MTYQIGPNQSADFADADRTAQRWFWMTDRGTSELHTPSTKPDGWFCDYPDGLPDGVTAQTLHFDPRCPMCIIGAKAEMIIAGREDLAAQLDANLARFRELYPSASR